MSSISKLQNYLTNAKDYMVENHSVERLKSFYHSNPEKAEELWIEAINIFDEFSKFEKLLEEKGLYVYYQPLPKKTYRKISFLPENNIMRFELRIFAGTILVGQVAVLKIIPPHSH